jgi:hypothetical protein
MPMQGQQKSSSAAGLVAILVSFAACCVIYMAFKKPELIRQFLKSSESTIGNHEPPTTVPSVPHIASEPLTNPEPVESGFSERQTLISTRSNEASVSNSFGTPISSLMQVQSSMGEFYGIPLANFSNELWLLRNDGAIQTIPRSSIHREIPLPGTFQAIATERLMQELRKEFGSSYLVQLQQPYIFISKSNHVGQWASRFRSLSDSMRLFCRTKGLKTQDLEFPLIAIVFGSETEFLRYANQQGSELPANCIGFYSQKDNRIAMFEDKNRLTQQETLDTISHEAAHQFAFNLGLHRRCASSGLWLAEGFATLFEAPELSHVTREGRSSWPASRRRSWDELTKDPRKIAESLDSLVRNDNLFKHDSDTAYTVAWALTHYLAEREPRKFAEFVFQTSRLPFAEEFSSKDRWIHFRTVFGVEPSKLTRQIQKHVDSLR